MQLNTSAVAERLFITSKTINRYFNRVVGISPKSFLSIFNRFRTDNQKDRAALLFERFPDLRTAYGLSMGLSQIFENTKDKVFGLANLAKWHEKVRQTGFKAFDIIARSIKNHYPTIELFRQQIYKCFSEIFQC